MTNHNKQLSNQFSTGGGNRFGLIQLSDLQFGEKHRFKDDSPAFVYKLVRDISKMSKEHNFRPLYIVLSGDISETGHDVEFEEATKVLCHLFDELNIERNKILCIPGNHDVNWDLAKKTEEFGDKQVKFNPYYNFVAEITQSQQSQLKDCYPRIIDTQLKNELGLELEFLLLNSCEKVDHKNDEAYVCPDKLRRTLRDKSTNERLKIAIMHHRFDTIPNEAPGIINARDIQTILECNKYNIVLTGHIHLGTVKSNTDSTGHTIIYASCGSTGIIGREREDGIQNQYCIHVIDFDRNSFQTIWRAFNPAYPTEIGRGGWTQDNSYVKNPTAEFPLSAIRREQPVDYNVKTEDTSSRERTLGSKAERDKMKLAFLNLIGDWKENG